MSKYQKYKLKTLKNIFHQFRKKKNKIIVIEVAYVIVSGMIAYYAKYVLFPAPVLLLFTL